MKQPPSLDHLPPALRPTILEELISYNITKSQVECTGQNAIKEVYVVVNVWTEVKDDDMMNGIPHADEFILVWKKRIRKSEKLLEGTRRKL